VSQDRRIVGNTLWASSAWLAYFGSTAIVLVVLTRTFEPDQFGRYVGAIGAVFFIGPLASLGAGDLLIKRHSGSGVDLRDGVALAVPMAATGGLAAVLLLVALRPLLLPGTSIILLVALALAELVLGGLIDVGHAVAQATERLSLSLLFRACQGGFRLLAALALVTLFRHPTISQWALCYVSAAAASAIVVGLVLRRRTGAAWAMSRPAVRDIREGVALVLGWSTDRVRADADKVLLVRFGFQSDAGLYGAAYRVLEIAQVPIRAAVGASMASFWRAAETPGGAVRLARRVTAPAIAYGVVALVGLVLTAPLLKVAFGDDYGGAVSALRWLAVVPLLLGMQAFAATALTAEGFVGLRFAISMFALVLNLALNLVLIPDHGWRGAAASTLITEATISIALWAALGWVARSAADRVDRIPSFVRLP
jgi:O-antigen/teichoic acid export membrane protein